MKPTPKEFNAACAKYMGYTLDEDGLVREEQWAAYYSPHDNMNQLLPVVDKILNADKHVSARIIFRAKFGSEVLKLDIKTALIDFVSEALNIEATHD